MTIRQYVADAFTDHVFSGNPAAVCVLEDWLSDALMQSIAAENNLSETAFAVKEGARYRLRWFTPGGEIDFCGHATLATAYIIMRFYEPEAESVVFSTLVGELSVTRSGEIYEMKFPAYALTPVPVTNAMTDALGARPEAAYMGRDLLCVFGDEDIVCALAPNQERVKALDGLLLHATAPGRNADCVSRTFAPKLSVPEDPVCGSGHCHIAPYWASRLSKSELTAYQASKRGGTLFCRVDGDTVYISGRAALFSEAEIHIF